MAVTYYNYTLKVVYDANGGTGAPSASQNTVNSFESSVTVGLTLSSTTPTRTGYSFNGWWASGVQFSPSQYVSKTFTKGSSDQTFTITLKADWIESSSAWGTSPSSVSLNGLTSYTFNINKASAVHHHTVVYSLGTAKITHTNVGTSDTVKFPTTWQEQLPNATSGTIVCTLKSYDSSGTKIGSNVTKSITGNVPSSVVPTVSVVAERINTNATIASWNSGEGLLVQGCSKIKLTATASGTNGSTISNITFYGPNLNKSGTETTATSAILTSVGAVCVWSITVTDSRGRTAQVVHKDAIYAYSPPSVSNVSVSRCTSEGVINEETGTYALFNATYAFSDVDGNNSTTQKIEYKLHSGISWTTLLSAYTSGADVVLGGGAFDADKTYDIRITITDTVGNNAEYSILLSSVQGFALGLKNDRARFGGVPVRPGLQIDWDLYLGNRKVLGSLWTGSWSSDDITVDGISEYTMFIVKMSGQGTCILAFKHTDGGTTYFRGIGGFSSSATGTGTYYINATLSGDTLTMIDCHSVSGGGTNTPRTVSEIIGII